jgi:hypothetical protein
VRVAEPEKSSFDAAARLAGLLSAWVRERLGTIARAELRDYDQPVDFLE